MTIQRIDLHFCEFPLHTPYKVSAKVYTAFPPIIVEMRDADGRTGWGEAVISTGYSHETPEGGWDFCREMAAQMIGLDTAAARRLLAPHRAAHPNAASLLAAATEMLDGNPLLTVEEETRVPLLDPVHSMQLDAIPDEIETLLDRGFRTLKVKVGFDVDADLARVAAIQKALAGRAEIRLDANRAFTAEQGCRFAAALDPAGIQLFEQPCASDDWDANAAVAAVSTVPVMMDESIYGMADIEHAAKIDGVGFVKLKLKKMGGLDDLRAGLDRIRALGMRPVMGDGVATDICSWMEACVARVTLDNAGEMNGFLKLQSQLFEEKLPFDKGDIVLTPGFVPRIDRDVLSRHGKATEQFAMPALRAGGAAE